MSDRILASMNSVGDFIVATLICLAASLAISYAWDGIKFAARRIWRHIRYG